MPEYAFDIKMFAVVRINAPSLEKAKLVLSRALDCVDINFALDDGECEGKLIEASISADDEDNPYLFEIDGVSVDPDGESYRD